MPTPIWPPDTDAPVADDDQKRAANIFRDYGKVQVEAPPGTGKTFLGVYLALCAYRLGWASKQRQTLFLTFSRNARVQIENEIKLFREEGWLSREEENTIRVSNYHAFYFEILRKKAGLWGAPVDLKPASILERQQRLESLLNASQDDSSGQAELIFALQRFSIHDLMAPNKSLDLDENTQQKVFQDAVEALRSGHPHYDDFSPLLLNLLEHCPELVEWLRLAYPVVILDEFQDTDAIQWEILSWLRPKYLGILYDRFQMIYEWRGARLDRLDQVRESLQIPSQAETTLTHNYRVGNAFGLVEFIQQLRDDDLIGHSVTKQTSRPWLQLRSVQVWDKQPNAPSEGRCLARLRRGDLIEPSETTAILTRSNYFADYLYHNLRQKKRGKHYRCRWIGGDNNPDERIRDRIWELRNVGDNQELRKWIGGLLDTLLPRNSITVKFAQEFDCTGNDLLAGRKKKLKTVRDRLASWWDNVQCSNYPQITRALRELPGVGRLLLEQDAFLDPDMLYYINVLAKAADSYATQENPGNWQDFCDHLESNIIRTVYLRLRQTPRGLYILTVHQSKGREFDHVILPWLSGAGEPARKRSGQNYPWKYDYQKFDDRRLLYVALTRARCRVTILFPADDLSPFLSGWKLL